jgi:hypothetical protein
MQLTIVLKSYEGTFQEVLARPMRALELLLKEAPRIVDAHIFSYVSATFDMEGSPAWAQLAALTKWNRQMLGFPAAHPILFRTGSFKSALIDKSSPHHVVEQMHIGGLGGNGLRIRVGTNDPRFIEHQEGTPHMPARPVVPNNEAAKTAFSKGLESLLVAQLIALCAQEEVKG